MSASNPAASRPDDIGARLEWAVRAGHPHYVWPHVPMPDWRRASGAVAAAIGTYLEQGSANLAVEGLEDATVVAAFTAGVGPLLAWWAERGTLTISPAVRDRLDLHLHHARRRAQRQDDALRALLPPLPPPQPALVLKGFHTARTYFPDPATRPTVDIDLVAAPGRRHELESALRSLGYRRTNVFHQPYRAEWVAGGSDRRLHSLDFAHADDPVTFDIHDTTTRTFHGTRTLHLGEGSDAWEPVPGLPSPIMGLRQPWLTGFLAMTTTEDLKHLQLVKLVELTLVIRQDTARGILDWSALAELIAERDAWPFVFPALALTDRLAPGTVDQRILEQGRAASPRRLVHIVKDRPLGALQQLDRPSLADRFVWCRSGADYLRCAWSILQPARTNATPLATVLRQRFYRLRRGRVGFRGGP